MSQCVPSWELEDPSNPSHHLPLHHPTNPQPTARRPDYGVAELTWKNGNLAMHGHGQLRLGKPTPAWDKPRASGGTLESVVDQATGALLPVPTRSPTPTDYDLVPFITHHQRQPHHRSSLQAAGLDALVPCTNLCTHTDDHSSCVPGPATRLGGSTCVASCSGRKRPRVGLVDGNSSASGSAASLGLTFDTCEINGRDDVGFTTSASPVEESPDTSYGRPLTGGDDFDSGCHSVRSQAFYRDGCDEKEKTKGAKERSSISTKRSRAAAVHNQSERKRRDRINQRMRTLQKLVPNSSKGDKASMLDEVIDYLKQLQAQVQMMSRMSSIPHMMMPMTMQQLQMSMMAQMAQMAHMGMGMGMMDANAFARPAGQSAGMPPVLPSPTAFLQIQTSWDGSGDRLPTSGAKVHPNTAAGPVLPDLFNGFMACQTQPLNMEAYNRMATFYQQLYQQHPASNPKT